MSIQTIKFNVGGQMYEITRSLLEMYPDTMLSKLVSDEWINLKLQRQRRCKNGDDNNYLHGSYSKSSSSSSRVLATLKEEEEEEEDKKETESGDSTEGQSGQDDDENDNFLHDGERSDCIFIDRDGLLFRFVLNYLRDGRVVLPITVDKNTFLHELSYYGIEMNSHESSSKVFVNIQANAQCVLQLNGLIESLKKDEYCIRFSRLCILQFKDKGSRCESSKNFFFTVRSVDYGDAGNKKQDESLYNCVEEVSKGGEDMKERCNATLGKFGLALKQIDAKDVYRQRTKFKVMLEIL